MPSGIEIASFALIVFAVGLNEFMLRYRSRVSKHHIAVILGAFVVGLVIFGPTAWYNFYKVGFVDIGQPSVVFKTIAEQQPFASSIGEYLNNLPKVYSLSAIVALLSIPLLFYVGIFEGSFGSIVILCWLVPFAWGFYHKSQYIFLASFPFALGGAWFAQYVIAGNEDFDGLKIVPTLIAAFVLFTVTPLGAYIFNYDTTTIFFNVASYDRTGWESTLQYFKTNTSTNTSIITWWDYGHWLTAVSKRFVLIDNLQYDHREIQDVARFFMKDTNEDDAYKVIQQYQGYYDRNKNYSQFGGVGLDYVAIDWTMIGKSGAMRFIATGNIENNTDGEYDTYTVCEFAPQYSNTNGTLSTDSTGAFAMQKTLVYVCTQNKDGLGAVEFISRSNEMTINAVDINGDRIPWKSWIASKNSSLFGVENPQTILSTCMQYPDRISNIPPTFTNFIYGSGDFKNFMMARLYFGQNIDAYKQLGLANVDWKPLEHFVPDRVFEYGFVETWKIVRNPTNVAQVKTNGTG
jgi:asparagine N-glycosylation enzyme membrane subunit Stt3